MAETLELVAELERTNEKLTGKVAAFRAEAYQAAKDLGHVASIHASDYAARRQAELLKKLAEIDAE